MINQMHRSKGNWTARRAHMQWKHKNARGRIFYLGVDDVRTVLGWWSWCKN